MKKSIWLSLSFVVLCLLSITFIKKIDFKSKDIKETADCSTLYNSGSSNECKKIQDIKRNGCINIGIKVDMPSFSFLNPETNREEGFEPDLARAVALKILGDENAVKFRPITPKTRGPLLDNGELDFVIATFTVTQKRKQSYNFTVPYYVDYIGFLVNKNSNLKSAADFSGKVIGVSQSTPTKTCLQEKLRELNIDLKFAEYTSYHELKTALAVNRIDVFSADKSILLGYEDEDSTILDDVICKQEYGMACKLEDKDFCDFLNGIISEMKADGTLRNLLKKWNLESNYF